MPRCPTLLLFVLAACSTAPAPPPSPGPLCYRHGVRAMLEDRDGRLWFGSYDEGACCWDGATMRYFTVDDGLTDGQVRSIQLAPDGALWFECGRGVSRYDGELRVFDRRDYGHPDAWRKDAGDLWFKGDEAVGVNERERGPGVYRLDGDALTWLRFPIASDQQRDTVLSITGLTRTTDGTVWFATYGAVIGYDGAAFTVIDDAALDGIPMDQHLHVRSVFGDSRGRLWIGNNGIGVLLREHGETRPFAPIGAPIGAPPALQRVFAIGEDRDGAIWFGTRDDGAYRFDGATLTHFGPDEGLACRHVWTFHRDRSGTFWAAGADASGVFRFDGRRFERVC